tara:strand:+ start:5638 stop:6330 length:693 start_codon:yes stop_codon:yes gene_type:complete
MSLIIFLKKVKNTFLTPRINNLNYNKFYDHKNFFFKILSRIFWFFPNNHQSKYWINANKIGHGYEKFIEMDILGLSITNKIKEYTKKEEKILDICCNVGRILNELNISGYKNLYGFDINEEAIKNSTNVFSKLNNANLVCSNAEEYLKNISDNFYDTSFSLGASLELIPPHFDVIKHISRITKNYFICIINENGHAYPRFWKHEFTKNSFKIIESSNEYEKRTLFVLQKV